MGGVSERLIGAVARVPLFIQYSSLSAPYSGSST